MDKLLGAYRHRQNIVLVLDTAHVTADFADKITLSPINSGFSRPMHGRPPAKRGLSTFQRLADLPRRGATVAECGVDYCLPDVEKYLVEKCV